jgi:hypothetical protein
MTQTKAPTLAIQAAVAFATGIMGGTVAPPPTDSMALRAFLNVADSIAAILGPNDMSEGRHLRSLEQLGILQAQRDTVLMIAGVVRQQIQGQEAQLGKRKRDV